MMCLLIFGRLVLLRTKWQWVNHHMPTYIQCGCFLLFPAILRLYSRANSRMLSKSLSRSALKRTPSNGLLLQSFSVILLYALKRKILVLSILSSAVNVGCLSSRMTMVFLMMTLLQMITHLNPTRTRILGTFQTRTTTQTLHLLNQVQLRRPSKLLLLLLLQVLLHRPILSLLLLHKLLPPRLPVSYILCWVVFSQHVLINL
mmetsp:Transcript_22126/g.32921  ORF Transcript_22126/g.32921 Transcript_22126/m.32921 type:complete len:202 (+) Transcript_22126:659-1264(+)